MLVSPDDLLRAARGERVPGLTHDRVDGTPLGPGPLTPGGWRAFDAARCHGFLVITDTAEHDDALYHLWRRWCTTHDLPEVIVSIRRLGRRAQECYGASAPDRVADVELTLDRTRRALAPTGLLAIAEMLLWAGRYDGCQWSINPSLVRVSEIPAETAAEFGAALLRIGLDVRLTRPGPYVDQDPDTLRMIAERRHGG